MTDPLFTPLKSHPSTWQQEVAQLRDENTELALQGMIRNAQAREAHEARLEAEAEAEALRARVATLEAALGDMLGRWELYCGGPDNPHGGHTDGKLMEQARAALQEGGVDD